MKRPSKSARGKLRVTRIGLGYIIILLLALLAAWNTGTNLLYIVVGGLASFITLSYLISFYMLRGLELSRSAPRAANRGRPFQVHVRLENHRRWFAATSLSVQKKVGSKIPSGYVYYLPAGQAARISVEECYDTRGEHTLEPYRIVCGFPFGLVERYRVFDDQAMVLVYPRVHIVRSNGLHRMSSTARASTQPSDDGDEYYGLREYVQGDDIRRIVWRVSARLGKWIVRELAQYQSRLVVIALDTSYREEVEDFNEQFETAVELTASLAIMLIRRRNEVSIVTPDAVLEGGEGKAHERRVLEMLARVNVTEARSASSQHFAALESTGSAVLYISPDPRDWGTTNEYGRVLDPRELVNG